MEAPEDPPTTESLAHSRDLSDTSEEGQHNGTQQIAGASATDEAAIISAARSIGTVQNSRTNIKQAFFFLKRFRFSGLESALGDTADDCSAPSTRTASLDIGRADSHRTPPGICPPPVRSRSFEKTAPEASEKLVATQVEQFCQYRHLRPFRNNRVLHISVLAFVILSIVIVALVSALYASHVFPVTSKSSLSVKDNPATGSVQTSSCSTLISSAQTSISASTSKAPRRSISSSVVASSPTTPASAPSSPTSSTLTVSSSSAASPIPSTPAPTPTPMPQSPTTAIAQVPLTTLQSSTCSWGCYGWDCVLPSTPCNNSWQCINGYCKGSVASSTAAVATTAADAGRCAWGGRPGMGCGDDTGCCDPYPCVSNVCQNV